MARTYRLRGLIQASGTIIAAGGQLVLRAPSRATRRTVAITCTDRLFPLTDDAT